VIGFVGAVPLRGIVGGVETPFFQLADAMVRPDYRRKFDYFDLGTRHVLREVVAQNPQRIIYGFTNHRSFLWFKKLGICDLIEQPQTCYVHPAATGNRLACEDLDWHSDEIDRQWDAHRGSIRAGLVRDGDYLRWRYASHPYHGYRLLALHGEGGPLGWAVIARGNDKHTTVIDMLVAAEHHTAMLQSVACRFDKPARTWFPAHCTPDIADRRPTETKVYAFMKESTLSIDALRSDLYFTMGDADWW
jgi:hypothetical protein